MSYVKTLIYRYVLFPTKDDPGAQWITRRAPRRPVSWRGPPPFTISVTIEYFDLLDGLVVRDTNNGGMAKSSIAHADLAIRKERLRLNATKPQLPCCEIISSAPTSRAGHLPAYQAIL